MAFNSSGNGATIAVTDGSHAINAPVVLADNLTIANSGCLAFGAASSLTDNGAGYSLNVAGPGKIVLAGSTTLGGGLTVGGGTLAFCGSGKSSFAGLAAIGSSPSSSATLLFGGHSMASFLAPNDWSFTVSWGSTLLIRDSAAVTINGDLKLGSYANGSTGYAVQSGGTLNINGFDPRNGNRALVIGEYPGGSSSFTLSGGLLTVAAGTTFVPYHSAQGA